MTEILDFVQRHLMLVVAFAAVLALVVFTEFQRLTQSFKDLAPHEVVKAMNSDSPLLLDVRESRELGGGMINGARHLPLSDLGKRLRELEKDKDRPVIVYCRSGSRSATACRMLQKKGFTDVAHLSGGIMAWQSANLPLTRK
ncbi:MAG TPA: rhodanese-like domain-containing protein [Gammaproteobacteria bacterium]|nr:rhodanese-like domain-containing protein [Gammaproteobacteria bacterium]